jgi:hypothetical protein
MPPAAPFTEYLIHLSSLADFARDNYFFPYSLSWPSTTLAMYWPLLRNCITFLPERAVDLDSVKNKIDLAQSRFWSGANGKAL